MIMSSVRRRIWPCFLFRKIFRLVSESFPVFGILRNVWCWDERESTVVTNKITERVRGYQATNSTYEGMLCFQENSCQSCNANSMRGFYPTKSSTTVTRKRLMRNFVFGTTTSPPTQQQSMDIITHLKDSQNS
ncbi:unnamed protein product [Ectocarpus sp. 12 AP-2014]